SVFHPHRADERIEGFVSDLSDLFDLLADPETLFLEAAQRLGRWDLVRACYDLLRDVFYATPGTFGYFREPETYPAEIRILASIDGVKDVEEVIAESGLEPFTAIDVVRQLIRDNAIELINPVQLFQLGTQSDADGSLDKACRLFRRAMERGLDDFDVELRLAQCLERLGRRSEAAECFLSFSRRCLGQLRVDDAIRSLERVAKLDPANAGAVEQLVDLFLQHNRFDQALEAAMAYAHRIGTETQKALQILLKLRSANLRDVRVHEKIIELATELGDQELVREERELIAQAFYDRRDAADALEAYQRMFCEGQDTLEIRLKLIQLHKENGNRQKAIEHINYLLNLGGRRRVSDVEQLLFLHNTMRELQPADTRSNRFLADYYLSQGQKEQALEIVRAWIPELE
ncbi:MAG TPA: tetratricopeptide repeat protein, partial [Planctomycetota bacterium]|nr:tetratricopeptide repeat protein [Planctomycetota bacterium]